MLITALAPPSFATTLDPWPLARFVAHTDVAAVGTVLAVRYVLEGDRPLTLYTFDVETVLLGQPGPTMGLVMSAGPLPNGLWAESGGPAFEVGEQLLVHVAATADHWRLVSWDTALLRQRRNAAGVDVVVDGEGVPLAALPCFDLAVPVRVERPEQTEDGPAPPSTVDPLLSAMRWDAAVSAVTSCIGGGP